MGSFGGFGSYFYFFMFCWIYCYYFYLFKVSGFMQRYNFVYKIGLKVFYFILLVCIL